jgi:hypothetical protein
MPLKRLLGYRKFDPKLVSTLDAAFDFALRDLRLVERDDLVCAIVARRVIEISGSGSLDARSIADAAVKQLSRALGQ